ncbi:MAG: ABC transporter ATP-binding protein [Promethearchaeota archaeon]
MENITDSIEQEKDLIETRKLSFIYGISLKTLQNRLKSEDLKNKGLKKINEHEEVKEDIPAALLEDLKVLNDINLTIHRGEFIALCGNTGSGKTTLIKTFNGLIPHFYGGNFYGYVRVLGKDTIYEKISDLSKHIGMVFQNPENQLVTLNVERELAFALENRGVAPAIIKSRIDEILNYLNISHLKKRHTYELSGGEQQRVAIASILISEPDLIVLDEPTSALDPLSALSVLDLLKKINIEKNITIIIIEHRLDLILKYCTRIIIMQHGKVFSEGSTLDVINSKEFFQVGLNIPEYIKYFYWLKQENLLKGYDIPISESKAADILYGYFSQLLANTENINLEKIGKIGNDLIKEQQDGTKIRALKDKDKDNDKDKEKEKEKDKDKDKEKDKTKDLIIFENVTYIYPNGTKAINNLSLSIREGEIIGILGKNGAGKSTFLRLINGLLKPSKGNVSINGKKTIGYKNTELTKHVGLMFQNPEHQLFLGSVEEELNFSLKNLNLTEADFKKYKEDIIKELELEEFLDKNPFNLSGGEKKKISLATILCRKPSILLFDEPTLGQDQKGRRMLVDIIEKEKKMGKTIIVVTHDIEFAYKYLNRIIIFEHGKILADNTKEKIFTDAPLLERASLVKPSIKRLTSLIKKKLSADNSLFSNNLENLTLLNEYLDLINDYKQITQVLKQILKNNNGFGE